MRDPETKSALLRVSLLAAALVAVIALIVWMPRSPSPPDAGTAGAAVADSGPRWETDLIRSATATPPNATPAPRVTRTVRDRQRRDQLRERIYQAYGLQAPAAGATPPSGGSPHAPLGSDAGRISPEYVQARIREDFVPLAKQCYEAAIERDAGKAGKLVFSFVIVGDDDSGGIVESAETVKGTTLDDEELVTCLRESMLSLSFAPPENGGSVSVTYPFLFDPGDGG
jgi:hypothetical protein